MDRHAVDGILPYKLLLSKDKFWNHQASAKAAMLVTVASVLSGCFSASSYDDTNGGAEDEPTPAGQYHVASEAEYTASTSAQALQVKTFHEEGIDGSGQLIAVVDTGLSDPTGEFEGRISDLSINLADENSNFDDEAGHGTQMAIVMAAGANDIGLVGLAPDAEILAIKADRIGEPTRLLGSAVAEGVSYAVDNGASIVNLSIQGNVANYAPLNEAIAKAAENDVVVVIATGNAGNQSTVTNSARNVGTTEFGDTTIAVTALDVNDKLASFATPCDVYDPYFCVAVLGENIATMNGYGTQIVASGTSIATAQVAGSIALLLEFFPDLTAGEAIEILLRTTDDLGAQGVDRVYGSGKINLERALQPVGKVQLGNNAPTKDLQDSYIVVSGAAGDSLAEVASFSEIALSDEYERMFTVDLSNRIFGNDRPLFESESVYSEYAVRVTEKDELLFAFGDMSARNQGAYGFRAVDASLYYDPLRGYGDLSFGGNWLHEGDEIAFDVALASDAQFDNYHLGLGATFAPIEGLKIRAGLGFLKERDSVLDMEINGGLGGLHQGESRSLSLSAQYDAGDIQLFGNYSVTESDASFTGRGIVTDIREFRTQSWNIGFAVSDVLNKNDRVAFGLGQSSVATSGEVYVDNTLSAARDQGDWVSLVPDARELVAEISYEFEINEHFSSSLSAVYVANPNHDGGADAQIGLGFGVTASF